MVENSDLRESLKSMQTELVNLLNHHDDYENENNTEVSNLSHNFVLCCYPFVFINIRIWRSFRATLATSIKPSSLNLTRFSITREVQVLEKKFKNKFTQETHFPAHPSPEIHMSAFSNLRPGVILPLFFERRSPTFSLLKKKKKGTPDHRLLILRLFAKTGNSNFCAVLNSWIRINLQLGGRYLLTVVVFDHMKVLSYSTYVFVKLQDFKDYTGYKFDSWRGWKLTL